MTHRMTRVIVLVGAAAAANALALASSDLAVVPTVKRGPTIDGALDDPAWRRAVTLPLDGFCDRARREKGEKPKDATTARIVTDKENLYLAFHCEESHPDGPWVYENERFKRRQNSHVMGGDYVAVAIDMGRFGFHNYYMFFVNPAGEVYRCFTWPHRYDLVLRDIALPHARAAAKINKAAKEWTVELKVPLKEMLRYPEDGVPQIVGLDLRRVQWGDQRGKHPFKIYWTGMANVTGNAIKPQYDCMATWKPLFDTYPDYKHAYASSKGWVQLIFPESFGHVRLAAGTLENRLISGHGSRLHGLIGTRASFWYRPDEMRAKYAKMFDATRMEYWADLRQTDHPNGQPKVIVTEPVARPDATPRFVKKPTVTTARNETRISFEVAAPTDVTVAVEFRRQEAGPRNPTAGATAEKGSASPPPVGARYPVPGRIVRHLAAGVLGENAPKPFQAKTLKQTLVWDHTDDFGKPVAPGRYRITVRLGLKPTFHHAIPLDRNNWWYKDPTPTEKGLDIEHMPAPTIGSTLGHFSYGTINYMSVDRQRDEVYVQTQHVYDGATGRKLRDLVPTGPRLSDISRSPRTGELVLSRADDHLYMTGPNEVWRYTREGTPAPFAAVGRHFIPELWGAHSNPHRGIATDLAGNIYKMHHYIPHTAMENQVTRIAPDGCIKDYGFIEIRALAAGLRVDRDGNVYVGCTIQPPEALPPKDIAARMPDRPRTLFKRVYGSIVKFGPKGGIIRPDPKGTLACPGAKGVVPYVAQGAEWVHPGFAPMLSRISDSRGGPGCSCRNGRFDLDDFGRLFIPDAVAGRVEIIDSNANTIRFVGRRGTPDAAGVELGWPSVVAASDAALYIADYLRYRVVRARFTYTAEEEVPVDLSQP